MGAPPSQPHGQTASRSAAQACSRLSAFAAQHDTSSSCRLSAKTRQRPLRCCGRRDRVSGVGPRPREVRRPRRAHPDLRTRDRPDAPKRRFPSCARNARPRPWSISEHSSPFEGAYTSSSESRLSVPPRGLSSSRTSRAGASAASNGLILILRLPPTKRATGRDAATDEQSNG